MKPAESTCGACGQIYLRHPRSRSDLCCRCRPLKKTKRIHTEANQGSSEAQIRSETELAAYLDHDELLCLICGSRHRGLYAHLRTAHKISSRDYKLRFNIPVGIGLVGKATKAAMVENARKTCEKQEADGFANLVKARSRRGSVKAPLTSYQRAAQVPSMLDSPNHPSKQTGEDVLYCKRCGDEVQVSASIALALQCRVLCEKCKAKS